MQVMCIEFARAIFDSDEPNSTEFDETTEIPVISLMPDQHELADMGGTMRLGTYPCVLQPETRARAAYSQEQDTSQIHERHRHRWEFNNKYREILMLRHGMVFSGVSRRTTGWWRLPSCATIHSCSAASSIRSSRAGPTGRILSSWLYAGGGRLPGKAALRAGRRDGGAGSNNA
jgi:hypothetical protein